MGSSHVETKAVQCLRTRTTCNNALPKHAPRKAVGGDRQLLGRKLTGVFAPGRVWQAASRLPRLPVRASSSRKYAFHSAICAGLTWKACLQDIQDHPSYPCCCGPNEQTMPPLMAKPALNHTKLQHPRPQYVVVYGSHRSATPSQPPASIPLCCPEMTITNRHDSSVWTLPSSPHWACSNCKALAGLT